MSTRTHGCPWSSGSNEPIQQLALHVGLNLTTVGVVPAIVPLPRVINQIVQLAKSMRMQVREEVDRIPDETPAALAHCFGPGEFSDRHAVPGFGSCVAAQ